MWRLVDGVWTQARRRSVTKPFEDLTYLGQVRRLRKLALSALDAYDIDVAQCKLIFHGENTTYRIDTADG